MITKDNSPIGWAMLMYELEDAKEHLASLIEKINSTPDYDEANLRIDLGHIYSHLNRAWHRRVIEEDLTDDEWVAAGQFPDDLSPI
jgi:hypothetical protein